MLHVSIDPEAAEETRKQVQQTVQNMGYMGAQVDLKEYKKGKKLKVSYHIQGILYHIAYSL